MESKLAQPEISKNTEKKMQPMLDFRSDTVTKPTPEMRRAMAEAEVGDDVYGEDPTINRLEERAAQIFGREASIFVPTGSMGNAIAINIHTHHGQEIICEERGHIFNYEMATLATFSGCLVRPIYAEEGLLTWAEIKETHRAGHLLQGADRTGVTGEHTQHGWRHGLSAGRR